MEHEEILSDGNDSHLQDNKVDSRFITFTLQDLIKTESNDNKTSDFLAQKTAQKTTLKAAMKTLLLKLDLSTVINRRKPWTGICF